MSAVERVRVVVLHGDPVARVGLSVALSKYSDLTLQSALDPLEDESPSAPLQRSGTADVVVADYLHGVNVAALGDRAGSPRVVIIAGTDREWEIRSALERGVRGYLLTGCPLDELAAAVRAVNRGARYLQAQVAARLAASISLERLTAREEQVLQLVVEGLCNKTIGRRLGIALGTVKSHLKSAFDKLNVASRTQAVVAAERRGLLTQAPSADGHAVRLPQRRLRPAVALVARANGDATRT